MRIEDEDVPDAARNFDATTTIGELIPGNYVPMDYCIQVKAMDTATGETVYINGVSDGLNGPEAWGMVRGHANDIEDGMRRVFAK